MSDNNSLICFKQSKLGITLRPNSTYEEWWQDGLTLAHRLKSELWAVGDWLRDGEAKGYVEQAKLQVACDLFPISQKTLKNAIVVCKAIELSRRRDFLSFSHHAEVANRKDADELLDWCEETDASRNALRKEKKARDEIALENEEILEDTEEDDSFDIEGEEEAEPEEEVEPEDPIQANMDATNKELRSWATETASLFKKVPNTPWLNETSLNIIQNHLKSAGQAARAQTGKDKCPKCEDGCTFCRDTGWMPKYELEMYS